MKRSCCASANTAARRKSRRPRPGAVGNTGAGLLGRYGRRRDRPRTRRRQERCDRRRSGSHASLPQGPPGDIISPHGHRSSYDRSRTAEPTGPDCRKRRRPPGIDCLIADCALALPPRPAPEGRSCPISRDGRGMPMRPRRRGRRALSNSCRARNSWNP